MKKNLFVCVLLFWLANMQAMHEQDNFSGIYAEFADGKTFPLDSVLYALKQVRALAEQDFFVFTELYEKVRDPFYAIARRATERLTKMKLSDPEDGRIECVVQAVVRAGVFLNENKTIFRIENPIKQYVVNGFHYRA